MKSFREIHEERTSVDGTPKKRYHSMFHKEGGVKFDKRFSMFKKKPQHEVTEDGEDIAGARNDTTLDKRKKMFRGKKYTIVYPVRKNLGEAAEALANMVEELGADREWGTDTLTTQLKNATPGQEPFVVVPNEYAQVAKGDEVIFRIRSVYGDGQAAHGQVLSGTVIGADTNRVRVRDANGKLYRVKYIDLI